MKKNKYYRKILEVFFHRIIQKYKLTPNRYYSDSKLFFSNDAVMKLFGKEDIISDSIAFLGYYEWELSEIIRDLSKKSNIMVDAGANMGYFSLLFLSNSPNGVVHAFEPNPSVFCLLEENIIQNSFQKRALINKKALAARADDIHFSFGVSDMQSGWGHIDTNSESIVEATTIDLNFQNDEIIDILKIDVEGYELEVLNGAKKLLNEKRIKNIFFEINEGMLQSNKIDSETLVQYIRKYGYQIQLISKDTVWAKLL